MSRQGLLAAPAKGAHILRCEISVRLPPYIDARQRGGGGDNPLRLVGVCLSCALDSQRAIRSLSASS